MEISVVGTGYVGLVTGVCLSEIGHSVTCIDVNEEKIKLLSEGKSPIFEPGLEELIQKNIENGRLHFDSSHETGFSNAEVIYIAVGTPQNEDGTVNMSFIQQVAKDIAKNIKNDVIVVTKSTVPVGTNEQIKGIIEQNKVEDVKIELVSNPEFLREGSAVYDTFNGDRIVIGAENQDAAKVIEEINKPFGIPIFKTDIRSAEMIKYASNAFLATKISFINEIANICSRLNANITDVSKGMGLDGRIGSQFLNAGIGYGGSCFPKDTNALVQIAGNANYRFELLESVIKVNQKQQTLLVDMLKERFSDLKGMNVAILGLAFKPNTDDMREAASIVISDLLIKAGANVVAYDPIASQNAKLVLNEKVEIVESIEEAISGADVALIVTEWDEIKNLPLQTFVKKMNKPIIFDGRNCYNLNDVEGQSIEYHSIGRPTIGLTTK